MNKRSKFLLMYLTSINFWLIFEIINKFSNFHGWFYSIPDADIITFIRRVLTFGTIIPAVLETSDLVGCLHLFSNIKSKLKMPLNSHIGYLMFALGMIFILLPFVITTPWIWAFVWTGFILLLDPILYTFHNEKSLLYQLENRKFSIILSLLVAGYICGFLWEFWNYWAYSKWYYTIPILENIKIFEIPVLGFLAYGPFALEIYVMYQFVKLIFSGSIIRKII
ncbi:MAG: hypothetical protein HYW23_03530 [Candidatus Aenigmarchaeota archaeon]|nr:hypothetical protein [Candidatus Aenigmarchaeota archaeon]